jgi:hypothetical protein
LAAAGTGQGSSQAVPAVCSSRFAPTRNAIQRSPRCPGEGRFAPLTGRWRILRHITASPGKSATSRAALIFIHFEDGGIT